MPNERERHSRHEGGEYERNEEMQKRTRSSHDNTPTRVLRALLSARDLHRGCGVFDGEETRRCIHM